MLEKTRKIIGIAFTVAYGGYLVVTMAKEAKELMKDLKLYKAMRNAAKDKPEEPVVIETYFVD